MSLFCVGIVYLCYDLVIEARILFLHFKLADSFSHVVVELVRVEKCHVFLFSNVVEVYQVVLYSSVQRHILVTFDFCGLRYSYVAFLSLHVKFLVNPSRDDVFGLL